MFLAAAVFGLLVLVASPKIAAAAQGKLGGLGPLKLGISEQDVLRNFGSTKPGETLEYDDKIHLLGIPFELLVRFENTRVDFYSMFAAVKDVKNQEDCSSIGTHVKSALTKYYIGPPDYSLSEGGRSVSNWLFDNGTVVLRYGISRGPSETH